MRYYVLSVSGNHCRVLEFSCNIRKCLRFINTRLEHQDDTLELISERFVKYLLDDANINFDWSDCKTD